ncbi:MAG: hypothetical protein ABSF50_12575 [Burkholderiaceae bacterium]|jgi:hypothetical protein
MLRFRRSSDSHARSEFLALQDATACKTWLATLTPPDSIDNLKRIAECIGEVMEGPLAPARKYEVIDRIRVVLHSQVSERIRDTEYRAVPLMTNEAEPVWALIDTAEDLREAYEVLIARLGDQPFETVSGNQGREERTVPVATKLMALHRALDTNALVLVLYMRLRVAVPDRLWDQHCRMGQLSRQLGVPNEQVTDPLHASLTETCREAFNLPILLALADPTMLSPAEFHAAQFCSLRWSSKVGFRIDSAAELGSPPVRPTGNPGPVVQLASNEHQVRLDTQKVLQSIERRIILLNEGNSPASLGLGDSISVSASRTLLNGLLRRWGKVMPESIDFPEQFWRPSLSEFALAAIAAAQAPDTQRRSIITSTSASVTYDYTRMPDDSLTRTKGELERERIDRMLEEAETWSVVGELPDSILCMRRHVRPRLNLGQLVGLKLGGKAGPIPFLLGAVQALQQGVNDNSQGMARPASTHLVRIRLIPGLPQAIIAAHDQVEVEPSYLLVPNAALSDDVPIWDRVRAAPTQYSLVLPAATFRPARTMRIVAEGLATVIRLDELVNRGLDYDHVKFRLV